MARGKGEGTISKHKDGYCGRLTIGYDENGKQKRKAFYGKTKREVQEKMNAAKVEIDNGGFVEPSKMTLAEWLDIWLIDYKKNSVKPKTYFSYCAEIRRYTKPLIGKYKIKELRNDIIQKFINDLVNKGLAPLTIRNVYGTLKASLEQATVNDLIIKNVAAGVKLPVMKRKDIRVLSPEEQARFIEVTKNTSKGELFILCLGTGLRIGELMALTWSDVDFEAELLRVNKTQIEIKDMDDPEARYCISVNTPKSKASIRTIPLLPSLITMLKNLKESQEVHKQKLGTGYSDKNLVFCAYNGNPVYSDYMRKILNGVAQKAEIDNLHIHCLRHPYVKPTLKLFFKEFFSMGLNSFQPIQSGAL